jgi:hypothetical protein
MRTNKGDKIQQDLRILTSSKEWNTYADVYLRIREMWKSQLIKVSGKTMEQIALERVQYASRIEGCDLLFGEIERIVEENKND